MPQVKWWYSDGSNGQIIDCHKYNGGIVMGLMDGLLSATSKMVTLTGLMDRLFIAISKMVAL